MLAIATASATAVVVWQRWTWLAFAAFAIATPQWLAWVLLEQPAPAGSLAALIAFGALGAAAAVGFELRTAEPRLRISSAVLLVLNAFVLAARRLVRPGGDGLADGRARLAGRAGGRAPRRRPRRAARCAASRTSWRWRARRSGSCSPTSRSPRCSTGCRVLAAYAIAAPASPRCCGAASRAAATSRSPPPGLGGHLLLALGQALVLDVRRRRRRERRAERRRAARARDGGRRLRGVRAAGRRLAPAWRVVLDAGGLAVLALLTAAALDGAGAARRARRAGGRARLARPPHRRPASRPGAASRSSGSPARTPPARSRRPARSWPGWTGRWRPRSGSAP